MSNKPVTTQCNKVEAEGQAKTPLLHQADMTFESSLEKEGALRVFFFFYCCFLNAALMGDLCSKQNKMDSKVTF